MNSPRPQILLGDSIKVCSTVDILLVFTQVLKSIPWMALYRTILDGCTETRGKDSYSKRLAKHVEPRMCELQYISSHVRAEL
jgi:hypothetical protein